MRNLLRTWCVVGAILAISSAAQAQTIYVISVEMDAATAADDDLLTAATMVAATGDASQAIRKLAAGIMGEIHILVNSRIDHATSTLRLDDGTTVALVEGDVIEARKTKTPICELVKCPSTETGAVIIRKGGTTGRPDAITIFMGNDCSRQILFTGPGKPKVTDLKCGIIK